MSAKLGFVTLSLLVLVPLCAATAAFVPQPNKQCYEAEEQAPAVGSGQCWPTGNSKKPCESDGCGGTSWSSWVNGFCWDAEGETCRYSDNVSKKITEFTQGCAFFAGANACACGATITIPQPVPAQSQPGVADCLPSPP